ncbi:transposase [Ruegeria pomeroyi]|uniref:transposase n=1 Tax=Ruegeria pomeroyi TaxID=89184 RepID=UPI003C6DFB22
MARFFAFRPDTGRSLPAEKLRLLKALASKRFQLVEMRKRPQARIRAHQKLGTAEWPEFGSVTGEQAAALACLAPSARDSGTQRGKRAIAGGRRALRHVMFQAGLVASHHNPSPKIFADRLRQAGKPHKVIITAVARKLVILANAPCRTWQKRAPSTQGEIQLPGRVAMRRALLGISKHRATGMRRRWCLRSEPTRFLRGNNSVSDPALAAGLAVCT